jgi:hypothetical protein|tara:strand:+ start:1542 stop:1730 length:189 start_codon:yes stop_codon:yes gene_type:complete
MLEVIEKILKEIQLTISDTNTLVLNGTVTDMERYRFLMGRLEGLKLSEEIIKKTLKDYSEEI